MDDYKNFKGYFKLLTVENIKEIKKLDLYYFSTYNDGLSVSIDQMIEDNISTIMEGNYLEYLSFSYYYGKVDENNYLYSKKIDFEDSNNIDHNILNFTVKIESKRFGVSKYLNFDFRPKIPDNEMIIDVKLKNKSFKEKVSWYLKNQAVYEGINKQFDNYGLFYTNGLKESDKASDIRFNMDDSAYEYIENNDVINNDVIISNEFNQIPSEWISSFFNFENDVTIKYEDVHEISSKKLKEMNWDWMLFKIKNDSTLFDLESYFKEFYKNAFETQFNLKDVQLDLGYRITTEGMKIYESPLVDKEQYKNIKIADIPEEGHAIWLEFLYINKVQIKLKSGPGIHLKFEIENKN